MPLSENNKQPVAYVAVRARVTIGATSYDCQSITPDTSDSHEAIKVACVGARWEMSLPGVLGKTDAIEVKILKSATKPQSGTLADLRIEIDESRNGAAAVTESVTIPCAITAVKPDSIEADGNRLQAWTVTLQPTNIDRGLTA